MDELSFNMLARDGKLNPTLSSQRFEHLFFDQDTGTFRAKQGPKWDGGWRWYQSETADILVLYNTEDPTCFHELTTMYMVDSRLPAELEFEIAKIYIQMHINTRRIVEHLRIQLHAQRQRAFRELFPEASLLKSVQFRDLKY